MIGLPSKKELAVTTISILKKYKKPLKASEINNLVAKELNIPKDVLAIENSNCSGSEYAYQMRWIRTSLKNKGLLENPTHGYWIIASK